MHQNTAEHRRKRARPSGLTPAVTAFVLARVLSALMPTRAVVARATTGIGNLVGDGSRDRQAGHMAEWRACATWRLVHQISLVERVDRSVEHIQYLALRRGGQARR